MITAEEARKLYILPNYTLAEVEQRIKNAATDQTAIVLNGERVAPEIEQELRDRGFTVNRNIMGVLVKWAEEEAA
jgi:putative cell wall-binding protein